MNTWKLKETSNKTMENALKGRFLSVQTSRAGERCKIYLIGDDHLSFTTSEVEGFHRVKETLTVKTANSVYAFERVDIYSKIKA